MLDWANEKKFNGTTRPLSFSRYARSSPLSTPDGVFLNLDSGKSTLKRHCLTDQLAPPVIIPPVRLALQCPNPACGSDRIMVEKAASVIEPNPISRSVLSSQFLSITLTGLVVGPALVLGLPGLGGLTGPAGLLVWWPITFLVLRLYCYYRALKIKSKHYQCNVCRYQWVISEERPALERIRLKQAEVELATARLHADRDRDRGRIVALLNSLTALVIVEQDDWQLGTTYAREALALAEERNNQQEIAYSLNNLGFGLTFQGEWEEAIHHLKRSLALFRELKDWSGCSRFSTAWDWPFCMGINTKRLA